MHYDLWQYDNMTTDFPNADSNPVIMSGAREYSIQDPARVLNINVGVLGHGVF